MCITHDDVEWKYGPDSVEVLLFEKAQEREFTADDIELAKSYGNASEALSEPLKPIVEWNLEHLEGAASFYLREVEIDIENPTVDLTGVDMESDL